MADKQRIFKLMALNCSANETSLILLFSNLDTMQFADKTLIPKIQFSAVVWQCLFFCYAASAFAFLDLGLAMILMNLWVKFADNTKIYHKIRYDDDIAKVQSDLCNLVSWSKEWPMLFNVEKCKVVHFGYNNRKVDYCMDEVNLENVTGEKDLGVKISEDLKWENSVVVQ